jgi:hypothetical protein
MSEIVWYIAPTAREESKNRAEALSKELGGRSSLTELAFTEAPLPEDAQTIVVVAGDGGARFIAEKVYREEEEQHRTLLLAGGGSENALYKSLVGAGTVFDTETLVSGEKRKVRPFHPCLVNGGDHFFLHFMAVGRAAEPFARRNEKLRHSLVPRDSRMLIAGFRTGFEQAGRRGQKGETPIIEGVVTAPDVRGAVLFPRQELHADTFTHVTVPPMSLRDMGRLRRLIKRGLKNAGEMPSLPEDLLIVRPPAEEVVIQNHGQGGIGLSGDFYPDNRSEYRIRRAERPIFVAALSLPPEPLRGRRR